jgi:lysozyme
MISRRNVWLALFVALGSSQVQSFSAAEGEIETRDDAFPPGILLEEGTRAILPPGVTLRLVYDKGLGVTKSSEGWSSKLYNDAARYCTIGYGHLVNKRPCDGTEPPEFVSGISEPRGEGLLKGDLRLAQIAAQTLAIPGLDDGQFAAVVDFIFNVGAGNYQNSTLRQVVNAGPSRYVEVPYQFRRWVNAGGKTWPGLQKRRDREVDLFFDGIGEPRGPAPPGTVLTPIDIRSGESP